MTEIVLETSEWLAESVARFRAMRNRIEHELAKTMSWPDSVPWVDYNAYECDADFLAVDNLDAIAAHGRCRFEHFYDYWGRDGRHYLSEVVTNPTWLKVACLANAMILDLFVAYRLSGISLEHTVLSGVKPVRGASDGITIYAFQMGLRSCC